MVNIGASNVLGIVGLISVSVSFLIIGYAGMVSQNKEMTPKLKLGKTLAEILCAAAVIVIAIGLITVPSHNEGYEKELSMRALAVSDPDYGIEAYGGEVCFNNCIGTYDGTGATAYETGKITCEDICNYVP